MFVPGFVIILYVINAFNHQLKEDERKMTMSRENVETAKKTIEVRKQRLEELKKQWRTRIQGKNYHVTKQGWNPYSTS